MTPEEIDKEVWEARNRTALKDPNHLRRWLDKSGRRFLVFVADDLMAALQPRWPDSARLLQNIVNDYRAYRLVQDSGEYKTQVDPITREEVDMPVYKTDALTKVELDRAIRQLTGQMLEKHPEWKITDKPL